MGEEEVTNKNIAEKLEKKRQNISKITNRLLEINAIKIKKTDGKEKFFSVVHSIKWLLLEKIDRLNKKDSQKEIYINANKEIQDILKL